MHTPRTLILLLVLFFTAVAASSAEPAEATRPAPIVRRANPPRAANEIARARAGATEARDRSRREEIRRNLDLNGDGWVEPKERQRAADQLRKHDQQERQRMRDEARKRYAQSGGCEKRVACGTQRNNAVRTARASNRR